jgi:hypothetical protein
MMEGEQTLFKCAALQAKISPAQCLANVIKAKTLSALPGYGPGQLWPCLKCDVWRRIRVSMPTGKADKGKARRKV